MADATLVSERTLERPSDNGQDERASGVQPQSDTDGQTSDNGKAAQEQDNIRKLQSTYDKKLAEREKAFQAQQQQAQRQIQQLRQEMREARLNAAPDDYTKLQLQLQDLQQERDQYAQAYTQTLQQQQAETERQSALREIADEFDVSTDDLAEATDYKSAVKLAIKIQRDKESRKQADKADKAERNAPDIGSGAPRTNMSQWERDWEDAAKSGDSLAMIKLDRTRPKGAR